MPKITLHQLKRRNACQGQVELFASTFGEEVEVTVEKARQYANTLFDFEWAGRKLLTPANAEAHKEAIAPRRMAYEEAVAPHWKAYQEAKAVRRMAFEEAVAPHRKAYQEAVAPRRMAFEEAVAPHWKAYKEAVAPHWKAYKEAVAPHWEAYKEAVAVAFAELYIKQETTPKNGCV